LKQQNDSFPFDDDNLGMKHLIWRPETYLQRRQK